MRIGNFGLVAIIAALVGFSFWKSRDDAYRRKITCKVHEGEFDGVEYRVKHKDGLRTSYGRDIHFTEGTHFDDITVVKMQDATSCIVNGQIEVLYPRGTRIVVMQDGLGGRWVVRAS